MNILVLSWRDHKHPQAGGAEQVMREHMLGWIKAGHKVTLFSSRFIGCKKYERSEGIEIYHSGDQYLGVKFDAFRFWLKNGDMFDLVVDQFHGIPFFTPLYVRKPKLAVLQEVAKEVWFLNGFFFPLNYLIGIVGYLAEPLIFLLYRNILFMVGSESARGDLVRFGVSKKDIRIIPHGVIIPDYKVNVQKEKIKTVMFLGALTKDKGVEDAIKAFSALNKMDDYRFWIVGRGSDTYVNYLKNLAQGLGLGSKVKFWGFVEQDKKFNLLARAHVLVNPSAREGWGLVNIEANAMDTPVVSYKSAGLIDSVKNNLNGVFCKSGYKHMAAAIYKLLNDKSRYKLLSSNAKDWASKFDWNKSRELSLILIETLKNES